MHSFLLVTAFLVACGGEETKPAPAPAAPPPAPVAAPAPPPAPVAAPVVASGPYTPDPLAQAAYDAAKTAKADVAKPAKPADAAAGKAKYDSLCSTCHGATGVGDGIAGAALPQKPANFTWKERWDHTTLGTKHWIVMNGITGTGMSQFGLTDEEAWNTLAYIEATFAPKAEAPKEEANKMKAPEPPPVKMNAPAPPAPAGKGGEKKGH